MASVIEVHAQFPLTVGRGGDIDLDPANWRWVHCLTFPVGRLHEFSIRPLKWIRYCTGALMGAEGHLSSDADSLTIVNYDEVPVPIDGGSTIRLYYHLSDDEKRRMCPLDTHGQRNSGTSTSSSSLRGDPLPDDFRTGVAERDGGHCVLTQMIPSGCDAIHMVADSKGDEYIYNVTRNRSRDPSRGDVIEHIDDVRNGLFLVRTCHSSFGKELFFLRTPNFAMDTTDVDPNAQTGEKRCTTHLFDDELIPILYGRRPGSPIQISDSPNWPPPILFDLIYGDVILRHFGTPDFADAVIETWHDVFYPDGLIARMEAEYKERKDRRASDKALKARRPDCLDITLVFPYLLVPPDELQAHFQHAKEEAEEAERRRVQEKVGNWQRQVREEAEC